MTDQQREYKRLLLYATPAERLRWRHYLRPPAVGLGALRIQAAREALLDELYARYWVDQEAPPIYKDTNL